MPPAGTEAPNRGPICNGHTGPELEDLCLPLLLEMIACINSFRKTPLQDDFNSPAFARLAWRKFLVGISEKEKSFARNWMAVEAILNRLVRRGLGKEGKEPAAEAGNESPKKDNTSEQTSASTKGTIPDISQHLTQWLENFYSVLIGVYPKGIEILGLRLEGYSNREIAQRLLLGLRLVKQVVQDMQKAWEPTLQKE